MVVICCVVSGTVVKSIVVTSLVVGTFVVLFVLSGVLVLCLSVLVIVVSEGVGRSGVVGVKVSVVSTMEVRKKKEKGKQQQKHKFTKPNFSCQGNSLVLRSIFPEHIFRRGGGIVATPRLSIWKVI